MSANVLNYFSVFLGFLVSFLVMLQVHYKGTNSAANFFSVGAAAVLLFFFSTYTPHHLAVYNVVSIICFLALLVILVPILYSMLRGEPITKSNILDVIILPLGIVAALICIYEKVALLIFYWG